MAKFLTLKHWQLFLLLIGVPIIFDFIILGSVISSKDPTKMFYLLPIMMILVIGIFFAWFYSLGTNLYRKLPETAAMSLTKFKIFLFFPIVYILLLLVFTFTVFSNISSDGYQGPAAMALIIPLHLFSMFCMFYCLYFIAKALKTVELQRPVTFSDYAGEFFLIWFFPIGIWIIQPRINKLFEKETNF